MSPHPLIDLEWIRQASGDSELPLHRCLELIDITGPNCLFDPTFYREKHSDTLPDGMSILEHFCRQTTANPCDPNRTLSIQQWHETTSHINPSKNWRRALNWSLAEEAVFSRKELVRYTKNEIILKDIALGPDPRSSQEICIFVHYDSSDDVQECVLDYLDALIAQNVCILFMTNSSQLRPEAMEKLKHRIWRLILTENRSYDWGLYYLGVTMIQKQYPNQPIILANDSVLLLGSLTPLFNFARSGKKLISGAIDCPMHSWHMQSFFHYCSSEATQSNAWRIFWDKFRPHKDKWFVINSHEFGFCRWLTSQDISMGSPWLYSDVVKVPPLSHASPWRNYILETQSPANPTVELWDTLIEQGFPFLKRSLLKPGGSANFSENLPHLANVISRLARHSGGYQGVLQRYL